MDLQQPGSVTQVLNRNLASMSKDQILIIKELCNSDTIDEQEMTPIQELPTKTPAAASCIQKSTQIPNLQAQVEIGQFKYQLDTPGSSGSFYCQDRLMHIDESSLSESSRINQKLTDLELNLSLADTRTEFDDALFQSDVGTPVLYEPEIFSISGSSTSLLVSKRSERYLSVSSSVPAVAESAESARSREYKSIHKMFAHKSKCESEKK